jgi:hypothetical protein
MTKQEIKQTLFGVVLLAILAEAMWLYEMQVRLDWASLTWLRKDLFSPMGIAFCAALAYLLPFLVKYREVNGKVVLTLLTFVCLNIAVFYFGEAVLKSLFSRMIQLLSFGQSLKMRLFGLIAVGLFAFGYFQITDKLILPVRKQQLILFILSAFFMFILGNITVFFIHGFGNGDKLVDAVKMGYPQFWICILMGLSGIFTLVYFTKEEE